jgi:hypothetical protein
MSNIKDFDIEDGVLFEYTGNETKIIVPDGVIVIAGDAFYDNTSIVSVTLPNSVTKIEGDSFRGCSSLESINIPYSVEQINSMAFFKCYALKTVSFENTEGWTAIAYNPLEEEYETYDFTSFDLSDPSRAAKYIQAYDAYYWEHK